MRFRPILTLAAFSLLGGCALPSLEPAAPKCPPLNQYSAAEIAQLAKDLRALPPNEVSAKVIVEDRNLRRFCGQK